MASRRNFAVHWSHVRLHFYCCVFAAVTLHAQAPPANDCAASGTVVNAITGEPVPHAMVAFGLTITGVPVPRSGTATDALGRWSITNTTCGADSPMASRPGFIDGYDPPVSGSPKMVELVSGSPLRNLTIRLMPEAVITGKVQDTEGDPIADANLKLMRVVVQEGRWTLVPIQTGEGDGRGNFRFGGLRSGRYVVCANSPQIT